LPRCQEPARRVDGKQRPIVWGDKEMWRRSTRPWAKRKSPEPHHGRPGTPPRWCCDFAGAQPSRKKTGKLTGPCLTVKCAPILVYRELFTPGVPAQEAPPPRTMVRFGASQWGRGRSTRDHELIRADRARHSGGGRPAGCAFDNHGGPRTNNSTTPTRQQPPVATGVRVA